MADWTSLLQSKINSNIKNEYPQSLKEKYPDISFVTADKNLANPNFPTIKNQIISMLEIGRDTDGETVNAVLTTLQTDVTTDKSESVAKTLIYEVMSILKEMRFEIISFPIFTKESDVYRGTMRARRTIGKNDKF